MTLLDSLSPAVEVLAVVLGGVFALVVPASLVVVGPRRLVRTARTLRPRLREAAVPLAALGGVLLFNKFARDIVPTLSWLVGVNITGAIYAVEGDAVARIQELATPALTRYFAAVYLIGYVFLLVFPFVAYLSLDDLRPLERLSVAFVSNYSIGIFCYLLFIAYGPRNLLPELVEPLLYTTYPRSQLLTSEVNVNTNVFPSLHTSLSTTVAVFAWWTRDRYPAWALIATLLAASVAAATVYLGIHWLTDVAFGVLLGVASALAGRRFGDDAA